MRGEIRDGDHERLLSLIKNSPVTFLETPIIYLSSVGGSVSEAIKIGNTIEQAALTAVVNDGESCASSCFMIFVAAPSRISLGSVFIHRPYVDTRLYENHELYEVSEVHQVVLKQTREYLQLKSVPSNLIDKMISLPSTDTYRLQAEDIIELGMMSPSFEEVSIAKCGVSSRQFPNLDRQYDSEKIVCVNGLKDVSRAKLLIDLIGSEKARMAVREYLLSKGGVESPDGMIHVPK